MIVNRRWAEIQPKCTVYADCETNEWALYLTNSPEEELSLIGLTSEQCKSLRVSQNETTPPVKGGRVFACYHIGFAVNVYDSTTGARKPRDTLIGPTVSELRCILAGMCERGRGRLWAMFGGQNTIARLLDFISSMQSVRFINKQGIPFSQRPIHGWEFGWRKPPSRNAELCERADSVDIDSAAMVLSTSVSADAVPVDEEQIERD